MREVIRHNGCRLCGRTLTTLFSLGDLHLSTFPKTPDGSVGHAPLELTRCHACTLIQLRHTAPMELLWSREYWYKSGVQKLIVDDLKDIAKKAKAVVGLKAGDTVIDVGANDGTFLSFFPSSIRKIGVEPAKNLQDDLRRYADEAICDFWENVTLSATVPAKLIVCAGMFYDLEDPWTFTWNIARHLHPEGVVVAQLMTLDPMVKNADLGNICHEHLEYYTGASLEKLFSSCGLEVFDLEENVTNGGSWRIWLRHRTGKGKSLPHTSPNMNVFKQRIEKNKKQTVDFIRAQVGKGKKVYWLGASTKSITILQYYGLTAKDIIAAADINPTKIGRFMVGTGIPIVSEDEAVTKADIFIVGPYAFREVFVKRFRAWMEAGGLLVFSTPQFEILGGKATP